MQPHTGLWAVWGIQAFIHHCNERASSAHAECQTVEASSLAQRSRRCCLYPVYKSLFMFMFLYSHWQEIPEVSEVHMSYDFETWAKWEASCQVDSMSGIHGHNGLCFQCASTSPWSTSRTNTTPAWFWSQSQTVVKSVHEGTLALLTMTGFAIVQQHGAIKACTPVASWKVHTTTRLTAVIEQGACTLIYVCKVKDSRTHCSMQAFYTVAVYV